MKRLLITMLAVILAISCILTGCRSDEKEEGDAGIDSISLETLAYLFTDMTDIGLEYNVRSAITSDDIGSVIGNYEFTASFEEGIMIAPMMSSSAFVFAIFRLGEGGDAAAFARELKNNANLNKWVCVSAETARAFAEGRTAVFCMCSTKSADALEEAFNKIVTPDFKPKDHLRHPLGGLSSLGFYEKMLETYIPEYYGFMDGEELSSSVNGLPEGFTLPKSLRDAEITWDICTNDGDEWDPARSAFTAIIKGEAGVSDATAKKNSEDLLDSVKKISLPLGDSPMFCISYSAEHGMYFIFAGTGSWSYYVYDLSSAMANLYRMDVIDTGLEVWY